jgi:hypothetical protein
MFICFTIISAPAHHSRFAACNQLLLHGKKRTEMMQKKMEAEMHAKALEARRKGV